MIHFTSENIPFPTIDTALTERWIKAIAAQYGFTVGDLNYTDNVLIYEIVSDRGFLHFEHIGYAQEKEHLKEDEDNAANAQLAINVTELRKEGKSIREIASELGITKSKVERILRKANDTPSI